MNTAALIAWLKKMDPFLEVKFSYEETDPLRTNVHIANVFEISGSRNPADNGIYLTDGSMMPRKGE